MLHTLLGWSTPPDHSSLGDAPGGSDLHTTAKYDPFGRVTSMTNPNGKTTTFAYDDALGREQTAITAPTVTTTAVPIQISRIGAARRLGTTYDETMTVQYDTVSGRAPPPA